MFFILKGQYKAKIVFWDKELLKRIYGYYVIYDIDKSDNKAIIFEKVYLSNEQYSMEEIAFWHMPQKVQYGV